MMPTNRSQLKELETVQALDGKRISLSISDSIPCAVLFVMFWTESILITIVISQISSFCALCNLTSSRVIS